MIQTLLSLTTALATALLIGTAPAAAAVEETKIRPGALERGADIAIPHLEGKTIIDGDVRITVRGGTVRFLGKSGDDYLVGVADRTASDHHRTLRFSPAGEKTVLLREVPIYAQSLSADGAHLVADTIIDKRRTRVRVFDAATGEKVAGRVFGGFLQVLDADGDRVLLGGWERARTIWWDHRNDTTQRLVGRVGYAADIAADRVASYTKDPYRGGCTVVTTISTQERLWRSCGERVDTFSPDGTRMATIHLLSDGIGPSDVWLRKAEGRKLAHYSTGWFGAITFESESALLLDANGRKKAVTVRCELSHCERATALRRTRNY